MNHDFHPNDAVKIVDKVKTYGGQTGKVIDKRLQFGYHVVRIKLDNGEAYNFAYEEVRIVKRAHAKFES
jgi:preprotein translocase subunit YajC